MMSVNGWAYQYVQTVSDLLIWPYPLLAVGFVVGFLWPSRNMRIQRGPHFIAISSTMMVMNIFQLLWLPFFVPAVTNGFLWMLVLIDLVTVPAAGFIMAWIAKARSRDAFGHIWGALMLFVPFATLWLLFRPRKATDGPDDNTLFSRVDMPTTAYILIGLAMMTVNKGITEYIGSAGADYLNLTAAESAPFLEAQEALEIESNGLELHLDTLLSRETIPTKIDDELSLMGGWRKKSELHFIFWMKAAEATSLTGEYRSAMTSEICTIFSSALKAGAIVTYEYLRATDKEVIEELRIDNTKCLL